MNHIRPEPKDLSKDIDLAQGIDTTRSEPKELSDEELEQLNPYQDKEGVHWERSCFRRGFRAAEKYWGKSHKEPKQGGSGPE